MRSLPSRWKNDYVISATPVTTKNTMNSVIGRNNTVIVQGKGIHKKITAPNRTNAF